MHHSFTEGLIRNEVTFGKYHYILHQNIGRIFFLKLTEMNCYLIMLLLPPLSSHMSAARKLTPHTVLEVSGHILNIVKYLDEISLLGLV